MAEGGRTPLKTRLAATGRMLVRSGREIGHSLQAICASGAPLSASLRDGEVLFLSRLLHVDPEGGSVVVACSDVKHANSELFETATITFACNHEGIHYEFTVAEPHEAEHAGAPAIRLSYPGALLVLEPRREPPTKLPAELPLWCEVRIGPLSFDARIVDVGLDARATMLYDASVRIDPGTRLDAVRIRRRLAIDLEVEEITRIANKDGRPENRAQCRVRAGRAELEALIRLFVTDLA